MTSFGMGFLALGALEDLEVFLDTLEAFAGAERGALRSLVVTAMIMSELERIWIGGVR